MAIQDDFTIDVVGFKITYTTAFVNGRAPSIYTVNELYSWLQDTFDEPSYLVYPVPMSAQTPTQYTLINGWYMDDQSMKALYGGSIQTSGWTKTATNGVTQLRWQTGSSDAPEVGDVGVILTGGTSGATGRLLAVDTTRLVAWVRNTNSDQFEDDENVTGTGVDLDTEAVNGFQNGETVWSNLFSVGALQSYSEIYIGQEDDYMGGRAYHTAAPHERRIEKLDEWWDSDVDFTASPNLLGGLGHFDILVKTSEAGSSIDSGRLSCYARRFGAVYSHFRLTGGTGNFVVPFAATSLDINSTFGPYTVDYDGLTGDPLEVGDVLENDAATSPEGRLRAIVTDGGGAGATGTFEFYLIGENEPLATTDRTLRQLANNDALRARGKSTAFDVNGTPTQVVNGPADDQGITITFGNNQLDVDEDSFDEEYAVTVDCNNVPLARVYRHLMFLTCRGNQDGTTPNTQDILLPSAATDGEAGEFYRAIGDFIIFYDGGIGSQLSEGDYVVNLGATASGVVVSGGTAGMGATGVLVLTQVKGTFTDNDQIARPTEHATNRVVVDGTPSAPVVNAGAPFGSFAGGRFFFAQGVLPINVPAADANNWETTDLEGFRRVPPTVRSLTFAGLVAGDRAVLLEVNTPGDRDVRKNQNGVGAAGAAAGDTAIPLDNTVALDVPATGWVRVAITGSAIGREFRFAYASVSGTTVTLETGANFTGTTTGSEHATILTDTGAFADFGSFGQLRVGMVIRNVTLDEWAIVLRKIDNDSIETTPLSDGGTWHSGGTADSWAANVVVEALVDADTIYFPFIDDTAITTSISKTVKYVEETPLLARVRFSSPAFAGSRIQPFEQLGITLTDANLTVTAIRTTDPIASV